MRLPDLKIANEVNVIFVTRQMRDKKEEDKVAVLCDGKVEFFAASELVITKDTIICTACYE